jgi:tetratricopeptide (TPR) repeat protein
MDVYTPCYCGVGKKVKFCCPELAADFEKIERMLDGEQRLACLEYLDKLDPKFQGRASILALRALVLGEMGQPEKAEAVLAEFLEKHPENPIALAESAMYRAARGDLAQGVRMLHRGLIRCEESIPIRVYDAIGAMAELLVSLGYLYAARAHWSLQMGMNQQDERPGALLGQMNGDPGTPLLWKDDPSLNDRPPESPAKDAFLAALRTASTGDWPTALDEFLALAEAYPADASIAENVAALACYSADPRAAKFLRKFAALDAPLDDAAEAWARVDAIPDPDRDEADLLDLVSISFPILDFDALHAQLLSDRRLAKIPIDLASLAQDDRPPPRDVLWLLDRPAPQSGKELAIDEVPCVVAEVFLFGRETDREPRLELAIAETEKTQAEQTLRQSTGELIGPATGSESTGQTSKLSRALASRWRLPEDTPPDVRERLLAEQRRRALLETWVDFPQARFGGQSPAQLAGDEKNRAQLVGALLWLEFGQNDGWRGFDFDELRTKLGLPAPEPIDPKTTDVSATPPMRWHRIVVENLDDEGLARQFVASISLRASLSAQRAGEEVLRRESFATKIDKAAVYGQLAESCASTTEALEYLAKARKASEESGKSPALWYLRELPLRIVRQELDVMQRLLDALRVHWNEPGVAQGVYSILANFGLVDPNQMAAAAAAPRAASPSGGSSLWTPDGGGSSAPAPTAPQKKSSLWMPGMD